MEPVILNKELRILNVMEEWNRILPSLNNSFNGGNNCVLDLSKVETIDGAGIQLILYILYLVEEFPKSISISAVSEKIQEELIDLGVTSTFGGIKA